MKNKLTEKEIMVNLSIDNFGELTKGKILELESMIDKLDYITAKRILDDFPSFKKTIKEILDEYKEMALNGVADNKRFLPFSDAFNSLAYKIQDKLNKDKLSFEEKIYVIGCMVRIVRVIDNRNKNDKQFICIMAVLKAIATQTTASELLYFADKS